MGEIAREFSPYPKELEEGGEAFACPGIGRRDQGREDQDGLAGNFTGGSEIEGFTVSFMHQDPKTAMQVTARIAEKFIEENTKERDE